MNGTILRDSNEQRPRRARWKSLAQKMAPATSEPSGDTGVPRLHELFAQNRLAILATYSLFVMENLFRLAQPFALGWAINDLLAGRTTGLWVLVGQHVLFMTFGRFRFVVIVVGHTV